MKYKVFFQKVFNYTRMRTQKIKDKLFFYTQKIKSKWQTLSNNQKIKISYTMIVIAMIMIIPSTFSFLIQKTNIVVNTKKFLNELGIYTMEVNSVEIKTNYTEQDAINWSVNESAIWKDSTHIELVYEVNSNEKTTNHNKDVIFMVDNSGSMDNEKLDYTKSTIKKISRSLLQNENNNVSIVTFGTNGTIQAALTNDIETIETRVDAITNAMNGGNQERIRSYYKGLMGVHSALREYTPSDSSDLIVIIITNGPATKDNKNNLAAFDLLNDQFPNIMIYGIQYMCGQEIMDDLETISNAQYYAETPEQLEEKVNDATLTRYPFQSFQIESYLLEDYFTLNSIDDISVLMGDVELVEENDQKIVKWDLGDSIYNAGSHAKMTIDFELKNEYEGSTSYLPVEDKRNVIATMNNDEKSINETTTIVLKNTHTVQYDINEPSSCDIEDYETEQYAISQTVSIKQEQPKCSGYVFKGWKVMNPEHSTIRMINDDTLEMPGENIVIRGTWGKQTVTKTMSGIVGEMATLYKVLENEKNSNGVAAQYTGSHIDSVTKTGNKNIYYYFPTTNSEDSKVVTKNNVLLGDTCWMMYRTTDIGGVKLLYNGIAENGKCLDSRSTQPGYKEMSTMQLSTAEYYYASNYNYNKQNKKFSISGYATKTTWSDETADSLIGKYTCKLGDASGECSTLYLVYKKASNENAIVYSIDSNSHYTLFGNGYYNATEDDKAALAGYQYKDESLILQKNASLYGYSVYNTEDIPDNAWFCETVTYNSNMNNYTMNNPFQVTDNNYSRVKGKYAQLGFIQPIIGTAGALYYIAGVEGRTVYYYLLLNGTTYTSANFNMYYSTSFTKNQDGTYNLQSPSTMQKARWYDNHATVRGKYICSSPNTKTNCEDVFLVVDTTSNAYYVQKISETLLFSKDVEYRDGKYYLDMNNSTSLSIAGSPISDFSQYHYTCWDNTGECESVAFITYIYEDGYRTPLYQELSNGDKIEQRIESLFSSNTVNEKDSTIKFLLEKWYEHNMLPYASLIEDAVYCNNRNIQSKEGWDPQGQLNSALYFKNAIYTPLSTNTLYYTTDLGCQNETDRFSVANPKAKLTYPVGLLTIPEAILSNTTKMISSGMDYWTMSPAFITLSPYHGVIRNNGALGRSIVVNGSTGSNQGAGIRPVITLKAKVEYESGNGTKASPYVIALESNE